MTGSGTAPSAPDCARSRPSRPKAAARLRTDRTGSWRSSVGRIQFQTARQFRLPSVAVRQQLVLVVEQLLAGLGGKLEVGAFDDGIHRTRLLAQPAVDALRHIDVVSRGPAGAVLARFGLNGDRLGGADRLTQLASDAAFLAVGVTAQRMLTLEARADWTLFVRVVD